jgi:hypothetical protein
MKHFNMCLVIMTTVVLVGSMTLAADNTVSSTWVDVTDQILANPTDKPGWTKDETGKIFRDAEGLNLKIVTTQFGQFLIDLKAKSVFKIAADNTKTDLKDVKLFQRDHGFSIVFRNPELKVRCKLTEKVEGMKYLQGIKALK